MIVLQTIAVAFAMFSAVPVPQFVWDEKNMRYALCACCTDHGDTTMLPEVVTCRECGQACSCEGCVAEHDPVPSVVAPPPNRV